MVLPAGKTCARLSMDMHFTDGPQDTVYFRAAAGEAKTPVRSAGMTFSLKHFTGNRPGLFLTAEKAAGGIAVFTGFTFLSDRSG